MKTRQRVIILGAGEAGMHLAQRLCREDRLVVLVDQNPTRLSDVQNMVDVQIVTGSASSPVVLREAGADTADIVAAVTGNDETNLLACALANMLNPKSVKLARIQNDEYTRTNEIHNPEVFNIRAVINPDAEVVNQIERMLRMPTAVDYGEFSGGRVKVIAVELQSGPLLDQPLTSFQQIVKDRDVRISGILRGENLFVPSASDKLRAGDVVYFVCLETSIGSVFSACESYYEPVRGVCIVGGGDLGLRLALQLDKSHYRVRIVERAPERCRLLAEKLQHVLVLCGDGTNKDFMQSENIGSMDMLIALTGDDETNILTCLMGRQLGVRETITRVNKNGYMPIVRAIGLKLSVNPRLAATNSMVHFLRHGLLLSTLTTHDEAVEMVEAVLTPYSTELDKPLKKLTFPVRTNLLAVCRGEEVFIPGGDTVLQAGDRVVLMCANDQLAWVDDCLIGREQ